MLIRRLKRYRAERWLRQHINEIDHDQANRMMRYYNGRGNSRIALMFAESARDSAPTPEMSRHMERWAAPLRAGRLIKFSTHPVTILEPVPDDLVEAVEEAFEEGVDE